MRRSTLKKAVVPAIVAAALSVTVVVAALPAESLDVAPPFVGLRAQAAIAGGEVSVVRDAAGRVRHVSTAAGRPLAAAPGALAAGSGPEDAARVHAAEFAPLFGVRSAATDLRTVRTAAQGKTKVVRFQQTNNGMPVIGGQLAITVDLAGNLVAINGEATTATVSPPARLITSAAAAQRGIEAVAKRTHLPASELTAVKPVLSVYDPAVLGAPDPFGARAVWQTAVTGGARRPDVNWYLLVEAGTGRIALSFSQVAHADRSVCDYANTPSGDHSCPGIVGVARGEGAPATGVTDVDNAYDLTGAFNTYLASLGRNGLDGADMPLVSSVRFCPTGGGCPYENAFWDGTQMVFGTGFASADDVVGHELAHGVTQFASGLLYYYQSGAINESISDILGELFDQSYAGPPTGNDTTAAKWLVGEDLPIGAVRDMEDPPATDQPDSLVSPLWNADPLDSGGVHTNSGVGNKAAYLMRQGGTFGGVTVPAISSATSVAKIWLGADELLSPGSDYIDLAYALQQSCANLGLTSSCATVNAAIAAVEMTRFWPAAEGGIFPAPTCNPGLAPTNVFADLFNRPAAPDLGPAWSASPGVVVDGSASPSAASGNAMLHATPFPDQGASVEASTTDWIEVPASGTSFLRFEHLDAFDWFFIPGTTPEYYDGGFVDIDVSDDEQGWMPLMGTNEWFNGPNRLIFGTGLVGFGGDSHGWTSSRFTLSSYAGKQVKFRFRQLTDGFQAVSAGYGWWIDDVRVYQCDVAPGGAADYNGDGFADIAIGEPQRDLAGVADAGAVHVVYGGPTGLSKEGSQLLAQGIGGAPGTLTANARFGSSVASGDFNGDGYTDIAIAAPNSPSGLITVVYGSPQGIRYVNAISYSYTDLSLGACCEAGGVPLAVGRFNGDTSVDLAFGLPSAGVGGTVGILPAAMNGNMLFFTQDSPNVAGAGEAGDRFGAALAAGDYNGDGRTDIAVGAPGEDVGDVVDSGSVTVLYGGPGMSGAASVAFTQSTTDVAGSSETDDQFGYSLAAGDITGDGREDLAVGAPTEDVGTVDSAGTVTTLLGSASGLTGVGSQAITQATTDIPSTAETGDRFAAAVAIGDFDGDGFADLAAGAPGEALTGGDAAGTVTIIPGTSTGLTATGSKYWSQDTAGVVDSVEANDTCGDVVLAVRIRAAAQSDLVFACTGESASGLTSNGAIVMMPGSPTGLSADGDQFFSGEGLGGGGQTNGGFGRSLG